MAEPGKIYDDENQDQHLSAKERAATRWKPHGSDSDADDESAAGQSKENNSGRQVKSARERADERWGMGSDKLADKEHEAGDTAGNWNTRVSGESRGAIGKARAKIAGMSTLKKSMFGGGIFGGALAIALAILSVSPFGLIAINNFGLTEIGGVQSNVYRIGRKRLYSTMFFFDQDGKFDGHKAGGLRRLMLENRRTNKLVSGLRQAGINVEFGPNGKPIRLTQQRGNQTTTIAQSVGELERAWDIRRSPETAMQLDRAIQEAFPDKTARWYGKQSKKLYKRWGLTRSNWLREKVRKTTGLQAVENLEHKFRKKFREKLFGRNPDASVQNRVTPNEIEENTVDGTESERLRRAQNMDNLASGTSEMANDHRNILLDNMSETNKGRMGSSKLNLPLSSFVNAGSLVRGFKITGYVDGMCDVRALLGAVEDGSRVLKATQLMTGALAISTIGDGVQEGAITGKEMSEIMSYINSKGEDGSTFFSSGGWQWWKGNTGAIDAGQRDEYSTGGGFTGTLASINNASSFDGVAETCQTLRNPWVQAGSLVAGVAVAIKSGGSSVVATTGGSVAKGLGINAALELGAQLLIPMVAGTVVDGSEKGAEVGNAWVSGFEVMNTANASNHGMFPLSNDQYAVLRSGYETERETQLANMSLRDRYFSLDNTRSLAFSFATSSMSLRPSSIPKLSHIVGSLAANLNPWHKAIAQEQVACSDPSIVDNNLAATPFCNLIVGIPYDILTQEDLNPAEVGYRMENAGHVDGDGRPMSDKYKAYLKQCTSEDDSSRSVDIIHEPLIEDDPVSGIRFTDRCYNSSETEGYLFNLYRMYFGMAEAEYQALTGTLDAEEIFSAGNNGGGSLPSGDAQELAQKILDSGKVSGDGRYMDQIRGIASGNGSCHVNPTVLSLIYAVSQKFDIYITSLNRFCTNVLTSSGVSSYHYREGGGHAVDIGLVDGVASTGNTANDRALLEYILPLLPQGSGVGQSNCRPQPIQLPVGVTEFSDSCNHIHIQVPVQ